MLSSPSALTVTRFILFFFFSRTAPAALAGRRRIRRGHRRRHRARHVRSQEQHDRGPVRDLGRRPAGERHERRAEIATPSPTRPLPTKGRAESHGERCAVHNGLGLRSAGTGPVLDVVQNPVPVHRVSRAGFRGGF